MELWRTRPSDHSFLLNEWTVDVCSLVQKIGHAKMENAKVEIVHVFPIMQGFAVFEWCTSSNPATTKTVVDHHSSSSIHGGL